MLTTLACQNNSSPASASPDITPSSGAISAATDPATGAKKSGATTGQPAGTETTDGWGTPVTPAYPDPVADPSRCIQIPVTDSEWRWGLEGYWTGDGLSFWMDKSVFAPHETPSFLLVKFLHGDRNWGAKPHDITVPRSLDFGPTQGADSLVTTCELCPILHTNVWGDNPTSVWYPVAGTLHFEQANVETREYVGTLEKVVFRRVGIFGMKDYRNWVVSDDCAYLATTRFDTRHQDGLPCRASDSCPNSRYHVCDPVTRTCVASQCDSGRHWDGTSGTWQPTGRETCPDARRCELVLDTDDWYYGAHIEHAYSTGVCVAP